MVFFGSRGDFSKQLLTQSITDVCFRRQRGSHWDHPTILHVDTDQASCFPVFSCNKLPLLPCSAYYGEESCNFHCWLFICFLFFCFVISLCFNCYMKTKTPQTSFFANTCSKCHSWMTWSSVVTWGLEAQLQMSLSVGITSAIKQYIWKSSIPPDLTRFIFLT